MPHSPRALTHARGLTVGALTLATVATTAMGYQLLVDGQETAQAAPLLTGVVATSPNSSATATPSASSTPNTSTSPSANSSASATPSAEATSTIEATPTETPTEAATPTFAPVAPVAPANGGAQAGSGVRECGPMGAHGPAPGRVACGRTGDAQQTQKRGLGRPQSSPRERDHRGYHQQEHPQYRLDPDGDTPMSTAPRALTRARLITATVLAAAGLATGGIGYQLATHSTSTTIATSTDTTSGATTDTTTGSSSSDSTTSSSSDTSSTSFSSSGSVSASSGEAQTSTAGS